jgi:anti-sigma regulatory factor (Ser/Thr protein kinase)
VVAPLRLTVRRSSVAVVGVGTGLRISVRLPTDLEIVEQAVDLVARHCLAAGLPAQRARFDLRVALCEALSNAIIYGNGLDPTKSVNVEVSVTEADLTVRVADEGQGFDPGAVSEPSLPEDIEATTGRGLYLIRQLMDHVYFNDRGNAICMVLRRA